MLEKIHRIVELTHRINQSRAANVFVDYSGHVDCLRIHVDPVGVVYAPGVNVERLMSHTIWDTCENERQLDRAIRDMEALLEVAHV